MSFYELRHRKYRSERQTRLGLQSLSIIKSKDKNSDKLKPWFACTFCFLDNFARRGSMKSEACFAALILIPNSTDTVEIFNSRSNLH